MNTWLCRYCSDIPVPHRGWACDACAQSLDEEHMVATVEALGRSCRVCHVSLFYHADGKECEL